LADRTPILFAGDPHGNFAPILRACADCEPGAILLVGDCGLASPLDDVLAQPIARGWSVHWILGNHDTETEQAFDNLTACSGDLGLRATTIGDRRIVGLPGVFRPRVWQPDEPPPSFHRRADFLASLTPAQRWRGGMPLWHRDTIFPEDFEHLAGLRCDILLSHEAPSSHAHGFQVIDDLAATCGARLIVHGHHHKSYAATLPNGIAVRGLGLAEPWLLPDTM
jgi:predicted phosphodiesterase